MSAKKKKRISYEEYNKKRQSATKKIWLVLIMLILISVTIAVVGINRRKERLEQFWQQTERHYYQSSENAEE